MAVSCGSGAQNKTALCKGCRLLCESRLMIFISELLYPGRLSVFQNRGTGSLFRASGAVRIPVGILVSGIRVRTVFPVGILIVSVPVRVFFAVCGKPL